MTYIENSYWLAGLEQVHQANVDTYELLEEISFASDIELAQAYDVCMEGEDREVFPLYMVVNEMQHRGLAFDDLEGLLAHQFE
ncbi:MAG: hypothetical protein GY914_00975 [Prochlorococcus sp.]|nr:hypothetical protein [Prochlorococcus sp.]